jgi:GNAT superfamily N-acetyltransferase
VFRAGRLEDADALAAVFVAARVELTYLPPPDLSTMRRVFRERVLPSNEVLVAERDGLVVGFASLLGTLLDHLYVHPGEQGRGLGTALLAWAKEQRPDGLELWVFQANEGARRLYERSGFRLAELTDGAGNMERVPDARYVYP